MGSAVGRTEEGSGPPSPDRRPGRRRAKIRGRRGRPAAGPAGGTGEGKTRSREPGGPTPTSPSPPPGPPTPPFRKAGTAATRLKGPKNLFARDRAGSWARAPGGAAQLQRELALRLWCAAVSCAVRLAAVLCGVRCGCGGGALEPPCPPGPQQSRRGPSESAPRRLSAAQVRCVRRRFLPHSRRLAAGKTGRLRSGQVRRGMLNRTVAEGSGAEHSWVQQVLPRPESGFSWTSLQCAQVSARSSDIHEHRRLLVGVARPAHYAPCQSPRAGPKRRGCDSDAACAAPRQKAVYVVGKVKFRADLLEVHREYLEKNGGMYDALSSTMPDSGGGQRQDKEASEQVRSSAPPARAAATTGGGGGDGGGEDRPPPATFKPPDANVGRLLNNHPLEMIEHVLRLLGMYFTVYEPDNSTQDRQSTVDRIKRGLKNKTMEDEILSFVASIPPYSLNVYSAADFAARPGLQSPD